MKNEKIVSAFENIRLSERDADRIYESILSSKTKNQRGKISLITALCAMIIAITVIIIVGISEPKSAVVETSQSNASSILGSDNTVSQQTIIDEEWINEHAFYNQLVIESDKNSVSFYGLLLKVENDYDELKSLVPMYGELKLPEYLPDGFEFSRAIIQLYVTEQNLGEAVRVEDIMISGEKIYQCYQFSENILNNINTIQVVYSNNNGEYVHFTAGLSEEPEHYSVPGYINIYDAGIEEFDNSCHYTDSKKKFCYANKSIDKIEYTNLEQIGWREREAILGTKPLILENCCFETVIYDVWSVTVDTEELLLILESLA